MNQCVPSWDLDDNSSLNPNPNPNPNPSLDHPKVALRATSNSINSSTVDVPTLDYEVAELTWENGQLAMHGLGPRRVPNKSHSTNSVGTKYTWEKPPAGETLEAIVNQGTLLPYRQTQMVVCGDELVPWLDHHGAAVGSARVGSSATMTMDALVPSSNRIDKSSAHAVTSGKSASGMDVSDRVGSCSVDLSAFEDRRVAPGGGGNAAAAVAVHEWSSCRDHSVSGSATFGMDSSRQFTLDTNEKELGLRGFASTSTGSPENTSSGKNCTNSTSPDHSACHSRPPREASNVEDKKKSEGKSSMLTKRSRAAAIHNQSERKRRDKINQRMKTLQKLVPNSSKTDKASMLDEVIEYLKQLQAQVQMMSRMNMSSMMMPFALQQQLQMSMMNSMGMGIGMGMGMGVMDLNTIGRPNIHGMSPGFHPSGFMPMASWDGSHTGNHVPNPSSLATDPMSAFLACQSQPMTMDAYCRMAALFQQMQHQNSVPDPKN